MAKYNTLTALFTAIANSLRSKTGGTGKIVADDFPTVIDGLSTGGITPTGTKTITSNGTHDVTSFATAKVEVPASGITPSGTKEITENGTFDVTSFASAAVNVQGLKARLYTVTYTTDHTATVTLLKNDWLKSLRTDPNAFVMMRSTSPQASTAQVSFWVTANFVFGYNGTAAYNSVIARSTASTIQFNGSTKGLPGDNYNAHLNIDANGGLWSIPSATYPIKAGTYQIIAGTFEMIPGAG